MTEGTRTIGWVMAAGALVLWVGAGCDREGSAERAQAEAEQHASSHEEHPEGETEEHPEGEAEEHPEGEAEEHPESEEHPDEEAERHGEPVTLSDVADEVERYVAAEAEASDGRFSFEDPDTGETLSLDLDRVHREQLADLGGGTYFVCADFETPEGKLYDLDFFVKEGSDGLRVTDVMLHKEAGTPRYTWYEEEGIWKRRVVGES